MNKLDLEWFNDLDHSFYNVHPACNYKWVQYEPFALKFPLVVDGNFYGVHYAFNLDSSNHVTIILLCDDVVTRIANTAIHSNMDFRDFCKELHDTAQLLFYGY